MKFRSHFILYSLSAVFALLIQCLWGNIARAQTLTLNGKAIENAVVGDTITIQYQFSPGDSVATAEVWLDLDNDSTISQQDYLLFETFTEEDLLVDGSPGDEDGSKDGQFETTLGDFFYMAPATFIFRVMDHNGSATALLTFSPRQWPLVIQGRVVKPDSTQNLIVYAMPNFGGNTSGSIAALAKSGKSLKHNFNPIQRPRPTRELLLAKIKEKNDSCGQSGDDEFMFFATLTDSAGSYTLYLPDIGAEKWVIQSQDWSGRLKAFYPPVPQITQVTGTVEDLNLAYLPATANIAGSVTDISGNPVLNAFGAPVEVSVGLIGLANETIQFLRTQNGKFSFPAIEGEYVIGFDDNLDPLYLTSDWQTISIGSSDTAQVNLEVMPIDSRITGYVAIGDTVPVRCAHVFAKSERGFVAEEYTDDQGYFELPVGSADDPWQVVLDTRSIPNGYHVADDMWSVMAHPGDTGVNFTLVANGENRPPDSSSMKILSIKDIPRDQGLQVRVIWSASEYDQSSDQMGAEGSYMPGIKEYGLWRRGPKIQSGQPKRSEKSGLHHVTSLREMISSASKLGPGSSFQIEGEPYIWDFIVTIPAIRVKAYSYVAPTLHDSTEFSRGWSYFMVSAHSDEGMSIFFTEPDSGYSVDNLAPILTNVQARLMQSGVALSWETLDSPDIVGARIYRSQDNAFSPGPGNFIGATRDFHYFDAAGNGNYYYRIEVEDDAGNRALTDPIQPKLTGVLSRRPEGDLPKNYVLKQNYPNPFNPSTRIAFGIPTSGKIRLDIFDIMGRRIRTLVNREVEAGYYEATWDGRDDSGQKMPSGTYIYKIQTRGGYLQKKMVLSK